MTRISSQIAKVAPAWIYYPYVNLRCFLSGKAHKISRIESDEDIHLVTTSEGEKLYICRRGRHNRYKHGISKLVNSLAQQYSLDKLDHLTNGTFIDCGANVGELGIWATNHQHTYIPFEPEDLESKCCNLNNFNGQEKTFKTPLWNMNGKLKLFHRAETADSSLIENGDDENYTEIEVIMLDTALANMTLKGPIIFKVEAEGAEPEVLSGAAKLLSRIDYIAIDCGYERGINSEHTFIETNKFLMGSGFELISAHFKRVTALYKRTSSVY